MMFSAAAFLRCKRCSMLLPSLQQQSCFSEPDPHDEYDEEYEKHQAS
jgi:hypothetical protein